KLTLSPCPSRPPGVLAVAALAVDPMGTRVISGSYDYWLCFYDFHGMDSRLNAFRQLLPCDGHQVRAVSFSPSADPLAARRPRVGAGQVYDRDRDVLLHLARPRAFLPPAGGEAEAGAAREGAVPVTAAEWGPDGRLVAAGLNDGSLQGRAWHAWHAVAEFCSTRGKSSSSKSMDLPNHYAHTNVAWSPGERLFFTGTSAEKGGHGGQLQFYSKETLELVRVTGVSPDQSVVRVLWHAHLNQVGAVARTPQPGGRSSFSSYPDAYCFSQHCQHSQVLICPPFPPQVSFQQPTPAQQNPNIFATCGDKKVGSTHILYEPTLSERGALVCVARAPHAPRPKDLCARVAAPAIRNPHALPMFCDEPSRKRQREKARKVPVASQRPDLPMEGPGHGGRVGHTKGTLLIQYLLREGGLREETWMEEDHQRW
ncbi:unnamed protein product, partial [Closterium sp. NIES-53]